jgi:hypothetical protein
MKLKNFTAVPRAPMANAASGEIGQAEEPHHEVDLDRPQHEPHPVPQDGNRQAAPALEVERVKGSVQAVEHGLSVRTR